MGTVSSDAVLFEPSQQTLPAVLRSWGAVAGPVIGMEGVGHAGMLLRVPTGVLQGGFDPRSDGSVVAY